ncbi:MAG: hypothetical protein A4E62_00674 [Syntrophorhabdus sp. PtaU1.Bin002]|nr:MAG: hypothetical protein A4E58_01241 [Syntrophorhabdus sp. PtaB.Bin006]OPY72966.1 MAG: hypothetical protein A4E62_00674 [Syntrophorhabdus sp. PtaU1.Bin002]
MKKQNVLGICLAVVFLLGFMACSFNVLAAEKSPEQKAEQKADRKGLEQGLEDSLGMPVLKGDLWQKMTHDSKVAFVWGFGHVVSIEYYMMEKFPELKRDSYVSKVVEGMANTPMNEVVDRVTRHYDMHPDQIEMPVTSVLWDTMIKPNIKTGIAGRPLDKKP